MLSRSRLTFLRSLHLKKFRNENRLFIAEGEKLVGEVLHSSLAISGIYATAEWLERNDIRAGLAGEIISVTKEELARASSLVTPQEVLAVVKMPDPEFRAADFLGNYSLYLDGIRDPGNMGTILRVADWFGMEQVVLSPDCAGVWSPKVVQASMGSITRVNVYEKDALSFFGTIKEEAARSGVTPPPVYGAFPEGNSIYSENFTSSGILVIGNESNGIRPETESLVDRRVSVPRWEKKNDGAHPVDSLNAAIATAVICSAIRRKA